MRNVVGIAIFVACAGACFACAPPPLAAKFSGEPGAAGAGASAGTGGVGGGGATGVGGTPIADECRGHDIDIPSATLAGALSINGVPAAADPNTRLLLRNGVTDLVEIPFTGATYSVRLAPGTYDLFFSATGPTALAPANRFARLYAGVVVAASDTTTLDVDVRETIVSGVITVNGAPLAVDDTVDLSLRNAAGDTVPLAAASTGAFTARVVPGTFDLTFTSNVVAAGSATPTNQLARIASGITIAATPTATLAVDVPSVTISGSIAIGGVPAGPTNRGKVYLRNAAGDVVRIAVANVASYTARVVPGTYDLTFTGTEDAYSVTNQNTLLRTGVVVGTTATTALDVQVPAATVEGIMHIDGAPPEATDSAHLVLRNTAGDYAQIPWNMDGQYVVHVVPGTYDLFYAKDNTVQSSTPANQLARLRAGVVVGATGTTALDVQVPAATVQGIMHIDGEPPQATDSAHLVLRNTAGDYAQIPWNMDGQYVVHVVPGTYDLFYAKDNTVQSSTPANQLARLRAGVVVAPTGTTALDIDITSTLVMGALTINGVPAAAGNSGIVSLRSADGDRVTIANTARATYATRVVPGTYDLYYTRTASPANTMTEAPANHAARLRTGVVIAPGAMTVLDVDIPSTTVSGTITVNGAAAGAGDYGTLLLQSAAGDFGTFAFTNAGTYTARLIPGTYELYFSNAGSVGDTTPMNTFSRLRCFGVP